MTANCDEILIIGDSNAAGGQLSDGSAGYDAGIDVSHASCLERKRDGTTIVAAEPLDWPPIPPAGAISFALAFMRDWYVPNMLAPGRFVRATAAAAGGAMITTTWAPPSGQYLGPAVTRTNAALAEDASNVLKMIIWMGGSNDAINDVPTETCVNGLAAIFTYLRANITGAIDCPIVVSGIVNGMIGGDFHFGDVDNALKLCQTRIYRTHYMITADLLGFPANGPLHWQASAMREMGLSRIGTAYQAAVLKPGSRGGFR